jgi:hypothetical protein
MRGLVPLAHGAAGGLLLAAGVGAVTDACAQSRSIYSLSVPMEVEHDSNPNMSVGPAAGTTWLRATPRFTAGYVVGNEEFELEAGLTAEKSSNTGIAKDRLDPRVRAGWKHKGERDSTELALLLDRRAFRSLDVREQAPLGVDGSRTLLAVTGSWLHELDARTTFNTDLRHDIERFSGTTTPDFQNTTAAVRLTRELDERRSGYVALNAQAYRPDGSGDRTIAGTSGRSTVFGAVAGLQQAITPALRIDVNVGPVHFSQPSSRNGWQGLAKAEYTAQRWFAAVELSRAPGVNSTLAGLVATDDLRARVRWELDANSRLELDAGHARETAAGTHRSRAGVTWTRQWSPSWQLAVRASTHRQHGPEGTAHGNRIAVMLTYTAPDL